MIGKKELEELVWRYGLLNAIQHGGKASVKAVLGKILSEKPHLKRAVKDILPHLPRILEEVNRMPPERQEEELKRRWPVRTPHKEGRREKVLPPLPNAEEYERVATRFSPNPDCVLHLGSLRAIILSHEYAKVYHGLFILRFDDTDPRLKKSSLEFYDSIRMDLTWLGCRWDREYFQSDRIPIYYEYGENLVRLGGGYLCTCERGRVKALLASMRGCPCRERPIPDHLDRWEKMLGGGFDEGEAVVRVKTDLFHPNPAVRDWPAFRVIDPAKHPHPRVGSKYWAWPLYNFASAVDDHLMEITHIVRGKEHLTNTLRQKYLYRYFHWKYPETIHYGRLKVTGAELSKSRILKRVESGEVEGFDDPRLATLQALRRRGFIPEALRRMIMDVGPKPVDFTLSWENISAYNRKLIDPRSNRYFYVEDPVPLDVEGVPKNITVRLPLHPEYPDRGSRRMTVKPSKGRVTLHVSKADLPLLDPNGVFRLIGLFNVEPIERVELGVRGRFHSLPMEEARGLGAPLIQWVKAEESVRVEVVMPDGSVSRGLGEKELRGEGVDSIVQLVRFGFARIDSTGGSLVTLIYAHR